MPKQKSHSGAKKRVRRTGSGRIAMRRHGRSHLLMQKNKRQKRLSRTLIINRTESKTLKAILPSL